MSETTPYAPAAAAQALAAKIGAALTHPTAPVGALQRVEVPIAGVAALPWLCAQRGLTQYYWRDREGAFAMAGVGEADVLMPPDRTEPLTEVLAKMRARLMGDHPALRYYGGFRFRRGAVSRERWRAFSDYRFIVPRLEILQRARGASFACNLLIGSAAENARGLEAILALLRKIQFPAQVPAPRLPRVVAREDNPDAPGWRALVEATLDEFHKGTLEKAVLARETVFTLEDEINPMALLARLSAASPRSFEFCFHPVAGRAFVGASPERLYKRNNVLVESEALAGTRPRGKSDEEDLDLAEDLLHSEKDLAEHEFVAGMLRENLSKLCIGIEMPHAPRIKRLRHVQHLYTPVQGVLLDTRDADATLLDTLHPTPAVGGTPRAAALAWLDANEPFDRGIYAAPVGWVGFDGAEFCVAIRSGLVRGETLAVYTGAGIVAGSDPAAEWDEIENKLGNFLDALRVREAVGARGQRDDVD